jgi:hypothetical protein
VWPGPNFLAAILKTNMAANLKSVNVSLSQVGVTNSMTGARIGVTTFSDDIETEFGDNNGFHTKNKKSLEQILELLDKLKWSSKYWAGNFLNVLEDLTPVIGPNPDFSW